VVLACCASCDISLVCAIAAGRRERRGEATAAAVGSAGRVAGYIKTLPAYLLRLSIASVFCGHQLFSVTTARRAKKRLFGRRRVALPRGCLHRISGGWDIGIFCHRLSEGRSNRRRAGGGMLAALLGRWT